MTDVGASASVPISPEDVCPFPKALPRKKTRRGRPLGRARILTETPEKNETPTPVPSLKRPTPILRKKPKFDENEDSSSNTSFKSDSDHSKFISTSSTASDSENDSEGEPCNEELHEEDYVIVKLMYEGRKKSETAKYFVVKVKEIAPNLEKIVCTFMRRVTNHTSFHK